MKNEKSFDHSRWINCSRVKLNTHSSLRSILLKIWVGRCIIPISIKLWPRRRIGIPLITIWLIILPIRWHSSRICYIIVSILCWVLLGCFLWACSCNFCKSLSSFFPFWVLCRFVLTWICWVGWLCAVWLVSFGVVLLRPGNKLYLIA